MTNAIKKFSAMLLSAVLLLSALPVTSFADHTHDIDIAFSEAADGNTVASLILPRAEKLTAIDFSIVLTSDTAVIEKISTEGTDISDSIFDFDNLPEDSAEKEIFTYTTTEKPDSINFSGFFLNSLTTDESFHICDIIFSSEKEFSEEDIFEFACTLSCEECSKSQKRIYSLKNQDIADNVKKSAYPSGDADLSGNVDASDARRILRASIGLETLSLEEAPYADSDYDGKITSNDARFSLRLSVGLENKVMHCFTISLEEGKTCNDGGNYTFTCSITEKIFSMEIMNGGHICHTAADCLTSANCEVCNEEIHPAAGHSFDENGICTECATDKAVIDEAKAALITLLDEIHTYDTLAEEAFGLNKRLDFIKYIQEATKSLRKAADACEGVADLESVAQHLAEAYSIRFQAFVSIMDENGDIIASAGNCNTVRSAVSRSKEHIDYASFLYE